jgi:hypothetical protein
MKDHKAAQFLESGNGHKLSLRPDTRNQNSSLTIRGCGLRQTLRSLLADCFRWNRVGAPPTFQVVAAMLGLTGPIALGAATGHLPLGAAASIGGLALSMGGCGATWRERALGMASIAIGGTIATLVGSMIVHLDGASGLLVPVIAGVAGLIGSFNRPLAGATYRFIVFVIIAIGAGSADAEPLAMGILFLLGAVWTAGLSLGLQLLFEHLRGQPKQREPESIPAPRRPSLPAQFRRWRQSLAHWPAWQYPARIASCLTVAEALSWLFPTHRTYWVALTIAIVVRRQASDSLVRAIERALGTSFGVGLAMLLFLWSPPASAVIAMIAGLSALRPALHNVNYMAYATIMTPLVMLLLDLGRPPTLPIMLDRLFATIVGCGLSLTLGYLVWPQVRTLIDTPRN